MLFLGLCLRKGDIGVSLGTADVLFLWLDKPEPKLDAANAINPVDPEYYMILFG